MTTCMLHVSMQRCAAHGRQMQDGHARERHLGRPRVLGHVRLSCETPGWMLALPFQNRPVPCDRRHCTATKHCQMRELRVGARTPPCSERRSPAHPQSRTIEAPRRARRAGAAQPSSANGCWPSPCHAGAVTGSGLRQEPRAAFWDVHDLYLNLYP